MPVIKMKVATTILIDTDSAQTAIDILKPRLRDAHDLLHASLNDEATTAMDPLTIERVETLEGEALAHELNCRDIEPDLFEAA